MERSKCCGAFATYSENFKKRLCAQCLIPFVSFDEPDPKCPEPNFKNGWIYSRQNSSGKRISAHAPREGK